MRLEVSEAFSVLSVRTRVRILRELKAGPLCVNALAGRTGVTQPAVSQHLRVLKSAGFVKAEKRGCWTHYRLDKPGLKRGLEAAWEFLRSVKM